MSNKQTSLRAARIAKRTGIWGAIGLMIFAAGLSYALRGEILWLVMAAAGFGAAFHRRCFKNAF